MTFKTDRDGNISFAFKKERAAQEKRKRYRSV